MAEAKKTSAAKADDTSNLEKKADALVHKWVSENLSNSAFSRDTPAWNKLQGSLSNLTKAIVEEMK